MSKKLQQGLKVQRNVFLQSKRREKRREGKDEEQQVSLWGVRVCWGLPPRCLQLSDGGEVDGGEKDDGKVSFKTQTVARRPASARPAVWCESVKKKWRWGGNPGKKLHMIILRPSETWLHTLAVSRNHSWVYPVFRRNLTFDTSNKAVETPQLKTKTPIDFRFPSFKLGVHLEPKPAAQAVVFSLYLFYFLASFYRSSRVIHLDIRILIISNKIAQMVQNL